MKKQNGFSQIFVMVVMLVLAIALPVTANLVKKVQDNRSSAATVTIYQGLICTGPELGKTVCQNSTSYKCTNEISTNGPVWKKVADDCSCVRFGDSGSCTAVSGCSWGYVGSSMSCYKKTSTCSTSNCGDCNYTECRSTSMSSSCHWTGTASYNGYCAAGKAPVNNSTGTGNGAEACVAKGGACQTGGDGQMPTAGSACIVNGKNGTYQTNLCVGNYNSGYRCCVPSTTTEVCSKSNCSACSEYNKCQATDGCKWDGVAAYSGKCVTGTVNLPTTVCDRTTSGTYACGANTSSYLCGSPDAGSTYKWTLSTACSSGCVASTGKCDLEACTTINSTKCVGTKVYTCLARVLNVDHRWNLTKDCGTAGCLNGVCKTSTGGTTVNPTAAPTTKPTAAPTTTVLKWKKGTCNTTTGKFNCTSGTGTDYTFATQAQCVDYGGCAIATTTPTPPPVCTAGAKQCSGTNAQVCKADGTGWTSTACGTIGCNVITKVCNTCTSGTQKCSTTTNKYLTCSTSGIWSTTTTDCASGKICTNGDIGTAVCKDPAYVAPKINILFAISGVKAVEPCLGDLKFKVAISKESLSNQVTNEVTATSVGTTNHLGDAIFKITNFALSNNYALTDKMKLSIGGKKSLVTVYGKNNQNAGFPAMNTSQILVSDLVTNNTLSLYEYPLLNGDVGSEGHIGVLDNIVNSVDFALMKTQWHTTCSEGQNLESDLDGDCYVGSSDLQIQKNAMAEQIAQKTF